MASISAVPEGLVFYRSVEVGEGRVIKRPELRAPGRGYQEEKPGIEVTKPGRGAQSPHQFPGSSTANLSSGAVLLTEQYARDEAALAALHVDSEAWAGYAKALEQEHQANAELDKMRRQRETILKALVRAIGGATNVKVKTMKARGGGRRRVLMTQSR